LIEKRRGPKVPFEDIANDLREPRLGPVTG
jgi:hypothetical protein